MKSRILRYLFTAFAATGLFTALVGSSQARSMPAFMGQPQNPFDYTCFLNAGGSTRNNCTVTKQFCVGLPVDSSYHAVEITVSAPDRDHNITCGAQAVFPDAGISGASDLQSATVFGVAQTLYLRGLWVPAAGALYACCDVPPGGTVRSINY